VKVLRTDCGRSCPFTSSGVFAPRRRESTGWIGVAAVVAEIGVAYTIGRAGSEAAVGEEPEAISPFGQ
jgi:hypothetical protein